MRRHAIPRELVRLVAQCKNGLQCDVHDHHALGAQVERQDLERVSDQQTRKADVVENAEDPYEDELGVARRQVSKVRLLVLHYLGSASVSLWLF